MKSLSRVRLFVTLWAVAHQAPLSMGFSRQECWCGFAISFSKIVIMLYQKTSTTLRFIWCGKHLLPHQVKSLSRVRLFATPWTVAHQAPPSMGFSRQEYWSGLQFPSPGDLPNPGIEPRSPILEADAFNL